MDTGNLSSPGADSASPANEVTPEITTPVNSAPSEAMPPARQAPGQGQSNGQGSNSGKRNRRRFRRGSGGRNRQNRPNDGGQPSNSVQPRNHPSGQDRSRGRGFSGPMDHSYRQGGEPNGNTMQPHQPTGAGRNQRRFGRGGGRFRQGSNQNGGRGGQPFVAQQPMPPLVEPVPFREDATTRIFAFIEDLFFVSKIGETARKLNVRIAFVKTQEEMMEKLAAEGEEKPSLVIFDLNNANAKPLLTIPKLKAKFKKGTSILGFVSHVQGELKLKAQEAGCDSVVPRSAFSQNLPQILRRHGAPEDLDEVE